MLGWISIHRKFMEKGFYKKPEYVLLWLHLLLKANHKETEIVWNNESVKIKEGSFLTGRKSLSSETGINESKIERILKYFENEQQIEQQKTTKFRIIKIINWTFYQNNKNNEQQNEQQVNNKRTTSEQQVNTDNNDNKENNEKNDNKLKIREANFINEISVYKNEYPSDMLNNFFEYWSEPNKSKSRMKYESEKTWDLSRRLKRWSNNNFGNNRNGKNGQGVTEDKLRQFAESIANDPDLK